MEEQEEEDCTVCVFVFRIWLGTHEERGLIEWAKEMPLTDDYVNDVTATDYDFPFGINMLQRWKWTYYVPFLPTYKLKTPN